MFLNFYVFFITNDKKLTYLKFYNFFIIFYNFILLFFEKNNLIFLSKFNVAEELNKDKDFVFLQNLYIFLYDILWFFLVDFSTLFLKLNKNSDNFFIFYSYMFGYLLCNAYETELDIISLKNNVEFLNKFFFKKIDLKNVLNNDDEVLLFLLFFFSFIKNSSDFAINTKLFSILTKFFADFKTVFIKANSFENLMFAHFNLNDFYNNFYMFFFAYMFFFRLNFYFFVSYNKLFDLEQKKLNIFNISGIPIPSNDKLFFKDFNYKKLNLFHFHLIDDLAIVYNCFLYEKSLNFEFFISFQYMFERIVFFYKKKLFFFNKEYSFYLHLFIKLNGFLLLKQYFKYFNLVNFDYNNFVYIIFFFSYQKRKDIALIKKFSLVQCIKDLNYTIFKGNLKIFFY